MKELILDYTNKTCCISICTGIRKENHNNVKKIWIYKIILIIIINMQGDFLT